MRFLTLFLLVITSCFADQARIEVLRDARHLLTWNPASQEETVYNIYEHESGDLLGSTLEPFFEPFCNEKSYRIETAAGTQAWAAVEESLVTLSSHAQYPELTYEEWSEIAPYLMTEHHPAKKILDVLLSQKRALSSIEEFRSAGFSTQGIRNWSGIVVATHPKLKDFLVKLFLDDQQDVNELQKFMKRIYGARKAQEIVTAHGWERIFKVPKKWLYIVPENPPPLQTLSKRKQFILVVENMHILDSKQNSAKWKDDHLKKSFLDILYLFLTEGGFSDSPMAHNIPFAKDGRVAVIDTEYYNGPVPYKKLLKDLHSSRAKYWQRLIDKGGPQ